MIHFTLNNGVKIPAVGLGVFRIPDNQAAQETVEKALAVGYRHLDTAMIYRNEAAVGLAIKHSGVAREEIFLTTKLWNDDLRSGEINQAMETSLKKLLTDYVDLYLIHWPVPELYVTAWQKMETLYHAGKSKAIGVCNYQIHHLEALLKQAEVIPAVNQVECYPYLTQEPLREYCQSQGIYLEAWGPLGAGKSDILVNPTITEMAQRYNKTPAQVVLKWNVQRHVIVIPKSVNQSRMIENKALFDFELTVADMQKITDLNQNLRLGSDPDNFTF